jgi:hypothetical protein
MLIRFVVASVSLTAFLICWKYLGFLALPTPLIFSFSFWSCFAFLSFAIRRSQGMGDLQSILDGPFDLVENALAKALRRNVGPHA